MDTKSAPDVRAETRSVLTDTLVDDDKLLEEIGYVPSFKREFSNLATVCPFRFYPADLLTRPIYKFLDQLRFQHYGFVF